MSAHVVIVGAGFAGQHARRELVEAGYRVTLIDRHPYSTFQPLLYQVATGGMNPGDIAYPLRRLVSSTRRRGGRSRDGGSRGETAFRRATVTRIDSANKRVETSHGDPIDYDTLILAGGSGPNFFDIPGAWEHARTIYSRAEAIQVRDLLFSGLEAMTSGELDRRYTVLVVGGGPTGVEMAGILAELKSEALPVVYPELDPDSLTVVLAEMADTLLAPFAKRLQRYALRQLRQRGVDVRLGTAVSKVRADAVDFEDGTHLDVDMVIWASGVGAHSEVADWGVPQGKSGRIEVDSTLRVTGLTDVFAVGDCAIDPDDPMPQLAQPAIQMGTHAAREIIAADAGEQPTPFSYTNKGTMATIGRNAAVVQFPGGLTLTGFPAWALWVGVHLSTLLGGRNRVEAMVNTAVRYFAWPASATTIIGDAVADTSRPDPVTGRPAPPTDDE